jgi:hypothetical protein
MQNHEVDYDKTAFAPCSLFAGRKLGWPMTEYIFEDAIQHGGANVEEGLHRHPVPAHLLFLVHSLGDDLVDRTLDERRRDRFAVPTPGGVMHQLTLVL